MILLVGSQDPMENGVQRFSIKGAQFINRCVDDVVISLFFYRRALNKM